MKLSMYNTDTQDDLEMSPLLGKGTTWLNSVKRKSDKVSHLSVVVQSVNGASSTVHHSEHYHPSYFTIVRPQPYTSFYCT